MNKYLKIAFVPLAFVILYYVFGTNTDNYMETVEQKRKERLHFLNNSNSSPVENKESFVHPGFFNIQKELRINGEVERNPKPEQFAVEFSNGKVETYLHYGKVNFKINNTKQSLILFQHLERSNEYLLPYGDLSNGISTYGSGKYLPIEYNGSDKLILDFNLSENPYCAFNSKFACALPPKQNFINLKIEAGEKSTNH